MSLPYLEEFGWQADVLAVDAASSGVVHDPLLARSLPGDVNVIRVTAVPARITRPFGFQGLAWRSLWSLYRHGCRALQSREYDLIFFSTTLFPVIALGRLWHRRFRVPYMVDFQDPWQTDYYDRPGAPRPPGGPIKYRATQALARFLEPYAMRNAGGFMSVSPDYSDALMARYHWLADKPNLVLPFAASERDFQVVKASGVRQHIFDPADGYTHWVYTGVAGPVMAFALRGFFKALSTARRLDPERYINVRVHFVGTDYASAARAKKSVEPLAREFGVADMITEQSARIPYFEALRCLLDADALIVPGSDDPSYTASKIYPYILARKPLLAIFHERSPAVETVRSTSAGTVVTFASADTMEALSRSISEVWFSRVAPRAARVNEKAFDKHTAREMTRRMCLSFDEVTAAAGSS